MRAFVFVAVLVPLLLLVGCRKGAKDTAPANNGIAKVKIAPETPAAKTDKKAEKEPEPNWLKGPIGGKKDQPDPLPVEGAGNSGKQPWNVGAAPVVQPVPAPGMPPMPGPGGVKPPAGVLQPNPAANIPAIAPPNNTPLGAAARLVALADMRDLQLFIHDASLVAGKMPSAAEIYAALVAARSPAARLVLDGAIILTGSKERESVWAYEARAFLNGGTVVTQNGVEKMTAEELKKLLGK